MQKYIYKGDDGVTYEFTYSDETRGSLTIGDDGCVVYACGGKKTKFTLADCQSYREEKDVLGKSVIFTESDVDIVMLAIMVGEQRLMRNNDVRECGDQWRLESMTEKDENITDKRVNIENEFMQKIEIEKIKAIISNFKNTDKKIAELYLEDEKTQAEIATILEMSRNAVQIRLSKLLKKIRKLLKD